MSDTARHEDGMAVTAFTAGLLSTAIANLNRDGYVKIHVEGVDPAAEGFNIHCRTDAGFQIDVLVRLQDWSG